MTWTRLIKLYRAPHPPAWQLLLLKGAGNVTKDPSSLPVSITHRLQCLTQLTWIITWKIDQSKSPATISITLREHGETLLRTEPICCEQNRATAQETAGQCLVFKMYKGPNICRDSSRTEVNSS